MVIGSCGKSFMAGLIPSQNWLNFRNLFKSSSTQTEWMKKLENKKIILSLVRNNIPWLMMEGRL